MKQVIAKGGTVELTEVPRPTCREGEVLVLSSYSVISTGTESWTIDATNPIGAGDLVRDKSKLKKGIGLARGVFEKEGFPGLMDYARSVRNPTVSLGYSLAGTVVEVGRDVTDVNVGDRVACAGEDTAVHAEYVVVPRHLLAKIPPGVSPEEAAFTTVGAIALHAFRQSGARIGDNVVIIGAGLVGSLLIQICLGAGCRVAVIDSRGDRLKLASEAGASLAVASGDERLEQHIESFSRGVGADEVIICASTGSSEPVNLASRIARDRASVTIVGRVGMDFDRKLYYQKELRINMSRSLGPGRYDVQYEESGADYPIGYVRWTLNRNMIGFLELLERHTLDARKLVAGVFPLSEAIRAYQSLGRQANVACLLKYTDGGSNKLPALPSVLKISERHVRGKINVALVGPGNFAKDTLMPLLKSNVNFNLKLVVSTNPLHARQVAERYHFEKCGTSYMDALQDPEVDLVIITVPNHLHFPIVMDAIRAKKATFVEKPLCINAAQLEEIVKAQRESSVPIIVGFNRRYSTLIEKMKTQLSSLDGPFLLTYRVNADYTPMTRWMQDPDVGGGKIIHEGCHFLDLFDYLLSSSNPQISATGLDITGSTTVARDNTVIVLKYPDGSVASLIYTALGNRNASRERLEVFGQGVVMELDDFETLKIYGPQGTQKFSQRDKGHALEFDEVAKFMRGEKSSLITFNEAAESMKLTFEVERASRGFSEDKAGTEGHN